MDAERTNVSLGFVGLGVMGKFMCRNLARKGSTAVHYFDKDLESAKAFMQQEGLHEKSLACESLTELAHRSEIVFLSLPNVDIVEQVCLGEGGLCSGASVPKIIVDMGTSDVESTRRLARELGSRGVTFVDAPVARMPEAAREGTLLIMVGAEESVYKGLLPYLKTMGSDVVLCGATGAGQIVKIINNMVLISNVNVLAEALLIGEGVGVSGESLFNTLLLGSGSSEALKFAGLKGLVPRNFPTGRFSASYAMKDVALASKLAGEAGVRARVLETVEQRLRLAVKHGRADNYYPVIIEEIE